MGWHSCNAKSIPLTRRFDKPKSARKEGKEGLFGLLSGQDGWRGGFSCGYGMRAGTLASRSG
jgi:hypothetical protein